MTTSDPPSGNNLARRWIPIAIAVVGLAATALAGIAHVMDRIAALERDVAVLRVRCER